MALNDFKSQRLFLDAPLATDVMIEASREQANYLLNVLRMADGSSILVFNGAHGEWQATITIQGRKKCSLIVKGQTRPQPEASKLIYCFAPLKQARLDYMVQKAVEMGVGVFQPVLTQHTQVRSLNENRVLANAIEAAEQCGILSIPVIRRPVSVADLPEHLGSDCHLVLCDEDNSQALLAFEKFKDGDTIALLIGPEGGFSAEERDFLRSQKSVSLLGLGPRILRADTAAIAALAIIQSMMGDWYTGNDSQQ